MTYVEGVDFDVIDQSDPGDVTAAVTAVDLQLGLGNTSTSGCEAADFAGFPAGNIALLQRGTCTFELKAENAAAAGATGIVIFNQGNAATPTARASRRSRSRPTTPAASRCSAPPTRWARRWRARHGLRMRVFANTLREIKTTFNVLAETSSGNADNVVMVGAHLDSVFDGSRHQRQRLGQRRHPRGGRADAEGEAEQQGPLRLVGRGGVGPGRLDVLRQQPLGRPSGPRSPCT